MWSPVEYMHIQASSFLQLLMLPDIQLAHTTCASSYNPKGKCKPLPIIIWDWLGSMQSNIDIAEAFDD